MAKSTTEDQQTEDQPKERWWVVLHSAVDHLYQGQRINLAHLTGGTTREIDTDRLERLGAIAPVGSDEARALQESMGTNAVTPEGTLVSAPVPAPVPDITQPSPPRQPAS